MFLMRSYLLMGFLRVLPASFGPPGTLRSERLEHADEIDPLVVVLHGCQVYPNRPIKKQEKERSSQEEASEEGTTTKMTRSEKRRTYLREVLFSMGIVWTA